MSLALLGAVFAASLAGSLHCVGMCGGLVAFASAGAGPALAYQLARGAAYLALGVAAGAVGAAVDFGGDALGWSRAAMVLAGVTMIAVGVAAVARVHGRRIPKLPVPDVVQRLFARGHAWAAGRAPLARAVWIGALTAFLPCGWLYAFVLTAAGTGSPLGGVAVMAAFWAGTVPILLAVGLGVHHLARPLARVAPTVTAWLLVAMGLVTLAGRVDPPSFADRVRPAATVEEVRGLAETEPACCAEEDAALRGEDAAPQEEDTEPRDGGAAPQAENTALRPGADESGGGGAR